MSHVEHIALCVTSWDKAKTTECHKRIVSLGFDTSEVFVSDVNSYYTFFIPPCGSKAGWPETDCHNEKVKQAVNIIKEFNYEDGSSPFDYHVAIYGQHEG